AHLLLNHLPIIGTLIALTIFLAALVANRDDLKQAGLILFVLIALFAIPTYMTGSGARDTIQDTPGISMTMLEAHQGAALLAMIFMELTGLASLVGLWRYSRTAKNPWMSQPARMTLWAVLILAVVTSGLMAIAGNTGGDIRHSEITGAEESIPFVGSVGA